jgi:hypothetical protein
MLQYNQLPDCTVSISIHKAATCAPSAAPSLPATPTRPLTSPRFIDTTVRVPVGSGRIGSFGRAVSHVCSITNIDTL